jgi:hypothetical protein
VQFEGKGFEHVLGVFALHPSIVLGTRELLILGGRPPSWPGGWCHCYLLVEDYEEAPAFPFMRFVKWPWSLHLQSGGKANHKKGLPNFIRGSEKNVSFRAIQGSFW